MKTISEQPDLAVATRKEQSLAAPAPLTIEAAFTAALSGQISKESLEVAKGLLALDWQHKFNRAWFELRKEVATLEIYADKTVKSDKGEKLFAYCTEKELSEKLEPLLLKHGFTTLSGQELKDGIITVSITFVHESGHQETRCFSVRSPAQNRVMNDASKCDSGGATTAWRNLMTKCLGIKSRIMESDDPRNLGDKITLEQADELERRVKECNMKLDTFFKLAGADSYRAIPSGSYAVLDQVLRMKEQQGR